MHRMGSRFAVTLGADRHTWFMTGLTSPPILQQISFLKGHIRQILAIIERIGLGIK